jgi:hypothetical protein
MITIRQAELTREDTSLCARAPLELTESSSTQEVSPMLSELVRDDGSKRSDDV